MVLQQSPGLPVPLAQWSFGLPAILIGAALGFSLKSRALTLLTSAGIVLGGVIAWGLGWTAGLLQLGLGAAVLLACLMWPSPETAVTRFCARASMTVYLVHPLILSILERLTHLSRGGLALALLTMAVSFAYAVLQDYLMGLKSKPTVMP